MNRSVAWPIGPSLWYAAFLIVKTAFGGQKRQLPILAPKQILPQRTGGPFRLREYNMLLFYIFVLSI